MSQQTNGWPSSPSTTSRASDASRSAAALERIANVLEKILARMPKPPPDLSEIRPASDEALDGEHGDPALRFPLRKGDWSEQFVGIRFSQMAPELLMKIAEAKGEQAKYYQADGSGKANAEQKAKYARWDAERALGWARRIQAGWRPAQQAIGDAGRYSPDDDNPF